MKIGTRIVSASSVSVMVALAVGILGFESIKRADDGAHRIYAEALLPIAEVADIRHQVDEQRTALNRALLHPSADATVQAKTRIAELRKESDTTWKAYSAHIDTDQERVAAKDFAARRASVRALVDAELALMEKDPSAATENMLKVVGPSMENEANLVSSLVALNKDLAKATYDDAVTDARHATEAMLVALLAGALVVATGGFLLHRAVMRPLLVARGLALRIRDGHLKNGVLASGNDELSETLRALAAMDEQPAAIVEQVRGNALQVNEAARDMASGNDDLSNRTQEQASSLEETAASMEEMAATVKQNADSAEQTRRLAERLRADATGGHAIATSAVNAMERIARASEDIGEMAVLIDEIAFQTNLLALNAAVEAARAGEQGRGFTVVAGEVRLLAKRSADAAKDIKKLIASTRQEVAEGVGLVEKTGRALADIATASANVSGLVAEIAAASAEQSTGVDQVNQAVSALDEVTQQNAALVEEASAASRTALDVAEELVRHVAFFKLDDSEPVVSPRRLDEPERLPAIQRAPSRALTMGPAVAADTWREF